jgi:hypothetical protein
MCASLTSAGETSSAAAPAPKPQSPSDRCKDNFALQLQKGARTLPRQGDLAWTSGFDYSARCSVRPPSRVYCRAGSARGVRRAACVFALDMEEEEEEERV